MNSSRIPTEVANQDRLRAIAELHVSAPLAGDEFNALAELAAGIMDCPIGLVSLVLDDKQVFLGTFGTDLTETPIEDAFCAFTIAADGLTLVAPDLRSDPRFEYNRLVRESPNIRFYAGAAVTVNGQKVGTVCVVDTRPHSDPADAQIKQLERLARLASVLLEGKSNVQRRNEIDVARRRAEFRHSLALRAATIASWMWNVKTNLVTTDDTLNEWVDLSHTGALSMQDLLTIVHPDDIENVRDALDMAMGEDVDFHCEFRVRASDRWLMGQGRVYERDGEHHALSMAGVFVDITETKRAEQTTRLLLRELNHRVKNTLAMLQSLAAQTLKTAPSPDQFMRAFSGRLQALAGVHTLLSDNRWHKVSVHSLLRSLVKPYSARLPEILEVEGEDTLIGPDEGLGLGLVIHELATNAIRHGALSNKTGKVSVSTEVIRSENEDVLNLVWRESGGPKVEANLVKGLGSVLVERGLQKILKSSVQTEYAPDGVIARISFPIPQDTK